MTDDEIEQAMHKHCPKPFEYGTPTDRALDDVALHRAMQELCDRRWYGVTPLRAILRKHGFTIVRLVPTQTKADPE